MSSHAVTQPLYRVVERVDGPLGVRLEGEIVGKYYGREYRYNAKKRLYDNLQQARTYKKRLENEGREARILRFVYEGEVQ
jgi:hypothetical protein